MFSSLNFRSVQFLVGILAPFQKETFRASLLENNYLAKSLSWRYKWKCYVGLRRESENDMVYLLLSCCLECNWDSWNSSSPLISYNSKPYPRVCREKLEGSLALISSWKYQTSLYNLLTYFFHLRKKFQQCLSHRWGDLQFFFITITTESASEKVYPILLYF